MCIAILNKTNYIDYSYFRNSWQNNPDGTGFGYIVDDQLMITKFPVSTPLDEIYEDYCQIRIQTELPMIIHFRIATHGKVALENMHPFKVNDSVIMAHNGIIPNFGTDVLSDTKDFIARFLKFMPDDFHLKDGKLNAIESVIGKSKLVFLDEFGNFKIINEKAGIWDKEDWYSNTSYLYVYESKKDKKKKKKNKDSTITEDFFRGRNNIIKICSPKLLQMPNIVDVVDGDFNIDEDDDEEEYQAYLQMIGG